MGAAYLTVVNHGPEPDRLVAVESSLAHAAELHESVEEEGVMRMVAHPEGLDLPPGGTLELVPGGKHIMLIEPRLIDDGSGAGFPLVLVFERGGEIEIQAEVSSALPSDHDHHHHEHRPQNEDAGDAELPADEGER
jgi:copper(I)-binding protein